MPNKSFLSELARIFPAERLLTQPAQLAVYEADALTTSRQRPLAVVLPESQDEVVATVRLCHQHGVPFVPRGSGTGHMGGSQPVEQGIVIALNRLNRLLKLDPQQRLAVVEAGVVSLQISLAAARFGLYFPPALSSQPVRTLGGMAALNSGGPHCVKYGTTSDHLLGLKVVLADGEVIEAGSESVEGVGVGPDLVGLFAGSEGLLGIVLELTLRLRPVPQRYRTLLAAYQDLDAAGQAVAAVVASGLLPGALEVLDRLAVEAAAAVAPAEYPAGAEAVLIVELDGEADQVAREFYHLQRVIDDSGAEEVRVAESDEQRLAIWKGCHAAFAAAARLSPDRLVQDGVVPRGKLGRALSEINRLGREYELRVANVVHAGDGNVQPLILYDGRQPGALERAEALAARILQSCLELGGSISGEHGVGLAKRPLLPTMFSDVDMEVMRQIRRELDPQEIANRGKVLPGPPPRPAPHAAGSARQAAASPRPAPATKPAAGAGGAKDGLAEKREAEK